MKKQLSSWLRNGILKKMGPKKIEISHRTILFVIFLLAFLWFLFQIRQIILLLYVSLILMSALNPIVSRLEKLRLPRPLAILLIYFLFIGVLVSIFGSLLPSFLEQTKRLLERLPFLLTSLDFSQIDQSALSAQLGSLPSRLLKVIGTVFTNFVSLFILLMITFYLLMERKKFGRYLLILFGNQGKEEVERIMVKIEEQLGEWVRGQVVLCSVVGLMTYLGLIFLGIDFALPLALLAAILEILPNIGPVLAAIPAILIGWATSSFHLVAVLALYFAVQQIENYLIVPGLMGKAVHLSPLMVILSLMVGFKIGGILGALLAIPTVLILRVLILEISSSRRFQES